MIKKIRNFILAPYPFRNLAKKLIYKFNIGNYEQRLKLGIVDRPHYAYCVYNAAVLAKNLGYQKISVLEFGIAGGNGLKNLEYHVNETSKLLNIKIEIYGFDTSEGLPEPKDYRDLPYCWKKGFYKMDVPKLQSSLKIAKLVLGDIKDTSKSFFKEFKPAPIAAIMFDFDFYSSTVYALNMLEESQEFFLPRLFCYFDDTIGSELELYNDYTGVRLAINEFNQLHDDIKLGLPYHILNRSVAEKWHNQIWICHFFKHSHYNTFISTEDEQLPYL